MTRRRTLYLPALIVAAGLMACAAAVLAVSREAEATFPGKNGRIAYASLAESGPVFESIYTINPGGGGKTKVTAGYSYNPSFSPDGKEIAYTVYKEADSEIYTINVGGGDPFLSLDTALHWASKTQITHNNKDDNFPSYSPDGKKIAYSSTTYRGAALPTSAIYTVNVGGGGESKVTDGEGPSYSPDGKRIVYWAYDESSPNPLPDTEIYTINVSGEDKTQITHNNKDEFDPSYSPDGKRIAYSGLAGLERNNAEGDIYTINAGGGGKTQVTPTDNVDEGDPSYSPNGNKIAYTGYKGNAHGGDIYTINVSGGSKFRVTPTDNVDESGPSWGRRP